MVLLSLLACAMVASAVEALEQQEIKASDLCIQGCCDMGLALESTGLNFMVGSRDATTRDETLSISIPTPTLPCCPCSTKSSAVAASVTGHLVDRGSNGFEAGQMSTENAQETPDCWRYFDIIKGSETIHVGPDTAFQTVMVDSDDGEDRALGRRKTCWKYVDLDHDENVREGVQIHVEFTLCPREEPPPEPTASSPTTSTPEPTTTDPPSTYTDSSQTTTSDITSEDSTSASATTTVDPTGTANTLVLSTKDEL